MNWKRWLLSLAVLAMSWRTASAQEAPQDVTLGFVTDDVRGVRVVVNANEPLDLGTFWIGVSVGEVPEALRAHLKLEDGVGVLALDVVDKGPAQMAGLEKHDLLLKAGELPLRSAKDLIAAVNKAESNDLAIELLHKGDRKTVTVKPHERPADQVRIVRTTDDLTSEGLKKLLEASRAHPGVIIMQPGFPGSPAVPGAQERIGGFRVSGAPWAPLPNGVSVSISRTNNDPAKITVKRGNESWEITDKELDKLPADLRPHIEAMLGRHHGIGIALPATPAVRYTTTKQPANVLKPRNAQDEPVKKSDLLELEEKIKELSKKLDAIGKKE